MSKVYMNPFGVPLRKHDCSNIPKILPPKNENFQIKNSDIFHISAQNIDCGYSLETPWRGGSNEYPQSTFLSRYKKNNVYPCKPQFYYIKVGLKGSKLYRYVFVMTYFACNLMFFLQWMLKDYLHFLITSTLHSNNTSIKESEWKQCNCLFISP